MKSLFSQELGAEAEVRLIEMLFDRLPSGVTSALISIFLCFLVLFETAGMSLLKARCRSGQHTASG